MTSEPYKKLTVSPIYSIVMPDNGRVHGDDALRNQITHQYSMIRIAGMHT